MLCDDLKGWDGGGEREVQEGGDLCVCVCIYIYIYTHIYIADSFCCTAETNTTF